MSAAISPSTGRRYGIERVCRVWEVPRSSFYGQRTESKPTASPGKRGPRPKISDQKLLGLIRADLLASPFQGEGHRKVWARLKVVGGNPGVA